MCKLFPVFIVLISTGFLQAQLTDSILLGRWIEIHGERELYFYRPQVNDSIEKVIQRGHSASLTEFCQDLTLKFSVYPSGRVIRCAVGMPKYELKEWKIVNGNLQFHLKYKLWGEEKVFDKIQNYQLIEAQAQVIKFKLITD